MRTKSMRDRLGNLNLLLSKWSVPVSVKPKVYEIAMSVYTGLNTPVSLSCALLLQYEEFEQLARKTVQPVDYIEASRFNDDYQAVSFLKKYPGFPLGDLPNVNAWKAFKDAEHCCSLTNLRILRTFRGQKQIDPLVNSIIHTAQVEIRSILGDVNYSLWLSSCRFGPGVSDTCKRNGSAYNKLKARLSVTRDFLDAGAILVNSSPCWRRVVTGTGMGEFSFENPACIISDYFSLPIGNTVTFVPKTAVTHRPIAVEPHINMYAQLGIGSMIRGRLKRWGMDLDCAQAHHGFLAYSASIHDDLATIDLAAASDTISTETVRLLLPPEWFSILDATRSKYAMLPDGEILSYAKFSSMGNGFTFELETLIFWALARAACKVQNLPIYDERGLVCCSFGDDIIIPSGASSALLRVLEYLGFKTNTEKTYISGPFRESCGYDFFAGVNVRPVFQKEDINEIDTVYRLANRIRSKAYSNNRYFGCDIRLLPAWTLVTRILPRSLRGFVPPRIDFEKGPISGPNFLLAEDRGLIGNLDEAAPFTFRRTPNYVEGYQFTCILPVVRRSVFSDGVAAIAAMLYDMRDGPSRSSTVTSRRDTYEMVLFGGLAKDWPNIGQWL